MPETIDKNDNKLAKQWEQLNRQWQQVPLYVAESSKASEVAITAFRSPELSKPSVLANLPKNSTLYPVVALIDNMFIEALKVVETC